MLKKPLSEVTKTRIWKGTGLASVLSLVVVTAWAFNVTWNAPVSLVIDAIDLKVYWDEACTTPVTAIDFGNIKIDNTYYEQRLFVKNEGLGAVTIYWNSTLNLVTDQITDDWQYLATPYWISMNGTTISANQVKSTRYRIFVSGSINPGSYSWTLYLGATQ